MIDAVGPFRLELKKTPSLFVALAEAIVYQQLNGKAAATIFGRVCALFPRAREAPTAAADPARLRRRSCAAPASRAPSCSRCTTSRGRPEAARSRRSPSSGACRTTTVIERLTQVRGIGRWTAEMLLIFRLGRPDVLPVDDYGVRKGFASPSGSASCRHRKQLEKRGERWQPYRTVASWYLWRAVELAKT